MVRKLTDKQKAFVYGYLSCWNATKAAREAGYSEKYLHTNANKILQNTTVQAEIRARLEQYAMGAQEVLVRLAHQARGDIGDFACIQSGSELANHPQSYLVKKFKKKTYQPKNGDPYEEIELEIYDAHAPLVDLGRHHKLFTDKLEITGWKKELLELLQQGSITPKDIEDELGPDIAQEFFEQAGVPFAGFGAAAAESAVTHPDET